MKMRLTGVIEVQVEVETEIADIDDFYNWAGGYIPDSDVGDMYLRYLRDASDEETEVWASVPPLDENSDILSAEFTEAEVIDD